MQRRGLEPLRTGWGYLEQVGADARSSSSSNPVWCRRPQLSPGHPSSGRLTRRRWVASAGRAATEGCGGAHGSGVLALFQLRGPCPGRGSPRSSARVARFYLSFVPASLFLSGSRFESGPRVWLLRLRFGLGPGFHVWDLLVLPPDRVYGLGSGFTSGSCVLCLGLRFASVPLLIDYHFKDWRVKFVLLLIDYHFKDWRVKFKKKKGYLNLAWNR